MGKALEYSGYGVNALAMVTALHVQDGVYATRVVWVVYGLTVAAITMICMGKMVQR